MRESAAELLEVEDHYEAHHNVVAILVGRDKPAVRSARDRAL